MAVPTDRKYLETHEWHLVQGDTVTIGITQIAADELTDITFVDLPEVGDRVNADQPFGEIESVKATADLMSGISGEVTAVNEELAANPGLVNKEPYAAGWMLKVKMSDPSEMGKLLAADEYSKKAGH